MSNEEVSIKEITIEELKELMDAADIVQRFGDNLSSFTVNDGNITLEFDSI